VDLNHRLHRFHCFEETEKRGLCGQSFVTGRELTGNPFLP
jgi:hypothetical protein